MKKRFILITLCLAIIFLMTGCKNKESLTIEEFKTKMEEKEYTVQDITDYRKEENSNAIKNYDSVVRVYSAKSVDDNYEIEFCEFQDSEAAQKSYNLEKLNLEAVKGNASTESNIEIANYSKYTLTTNKKYYITSRIDNTKIYIEVDEKYKKEVKSLLEELGY